MGGGGGPFVPRSKDEMVHIPWFVDWALSFTAGVTSAICAAPFILIVDRAVTENSAGKSGLGKALQSGFTEFIMRPHQMLTRLPFWMVAGVYGATYATANSIDVACERQSTSATMHSGVKLFGVTAVNMSAGVAKDAAFARMFGAASGGAAALPVGWASLGLFAFRDLLTIGSAFIVPKLLAESLVAAGTHPDPNPNPNPSPNPNPHANPDQARWTRLAPPPPRSCSRPLACSWCSRPSTCSRLTYTTNPRPRRASAPSRWDASCQPPRWRAWGASAVRTAWGGS